MSLSKEEEKILMLATMANTLKKRAESTGYAELGALINQYSTLYRFVIANYPEVETLLPNPNSIASIDELKYAIEQLINYVNAKSIPIFLKLMTYVRDLGTFRMENPLTPLMPILNDWNLSVNWAVGASALALIEVMVNKKLEELKLSREGSFENRFGRLSEKAKEKGIQLHDLLASPFYKARSKIVHEGKEPTPEELEIIFEYLTLYSNSLKKI